MLNGSRYNNEPHSGVYPRLNTYVRQTHSLSVVAYIRDRLEHYNSVKYFPKPHSSVERHTDEPHLQKYCCSNAIPCDIYHLYSSKIDIHKGTKNIEYTTSRVRGSYIFVL